MKLFVGLDVSKTKLDVCFLSRDDDYNTVLYQTTVGNSDAGARHIEQSILQFHEELSFDKIVVGMEATGLYSTHPSLYFSQDPCCVRKHRCLILLISSGNPMLHLLFLNNSTI